MYITFFWKDGTIDVVEFNKKEYRMNRDVCEAIGKKWSDVGVYSMGNVPEQCIWENGRWVDAKSYYLTNKSPKIQIKKIGPKSKQIEITIFWKCGDSEVIKAKENEDSWKMITSALYNGGYSQGAITAIAFWVPGNRLENYEWDFNVNEWKPSNKIDTTTT
jgi:hypothetical protein